MIAGIQTQVSAKSFQQSLTTDLRLLPLSFLSLILVGAALLSLPQVRLPGKSVGAIDTLFLATSATCVTGLTTLNVAETYNGIGQGIILFLIQAGGLGIMTASALFVMLSGGRLSLAQERMIHTTWGRLRSTRPADVLIYACVFVFLFEFAGAIALFDSIAELYPGQSVLNLGWEAVFHSVSAFCNAGISIYPDGLVVWRNRPWALAVVQLLVVTGGIGLLTLVNLRYYYPWRRDSRRRGQLTLQSKLSLVMAAILIAVGTLCSLGLEWNQTLSEARWWEALHWASFHSVMTRTAGFNVVDVSEMQPGTLLGTIVLMFIGGAPGSIAGGIKTVTLALLVAAGWSALRRQADITLWKRSIPPSQASTAVMFTLVAIACLIVMITLLMLTESGAPASETQHHWLAIIFEAVSAFGTVGLSTGITPILTPVGKGLIIFLMFVGRVGPLFLAIYLSRPAAAWRVRYPKEEVALG